MKAHRRIQRPALNYDSLHPEHHYGGERLLPLPGASATGSVPPHAQLTAFLAWLSVGLDDRDHLWAGHFLRREVAGN